MARIEVRRLIAFLPRSRDFNSLFSISDYVLDVSKSSIIMMTSNGIGAGHLIRASAIARRLKIEARPVILSMAYSVLEVSNALGIECEFIPGRDKGLMDRKRWDSYVKDRLVALIDETGAKVVTFDGVVPYPGILSAKLSRPDVSFVWIRRGMWQRKPQGLALSIQSKLMDYVIEPGDVASDYDRGPTKARREALVTSPVSLYESQTTLNRVRARRLLGIEQDRPAVIVQIGVGERDLDERVAAILRGLSKWKQLQIVMVKEPKSADGTSLLPPGVRVQVVRHFPLADVIHAFDAAVCAAGYNSVHEVIPAAIPTLLVPNIRGTDDQAARARWCRDQGLALLADSDSLESLELQARNLANPDVRESLSNACKSITSFEGDTEIAEILMALGNNRVNSLFMNRLRYQRLLARSAIERGIGHFARRFVGSLLRLAALIYRSLRPNSQEAVENPELLFSYTLDISEGSRMIRGKDRFEHILHNSSIQYFQARVTIAQRAYKLPNELPEFQIRKGIDGSIRLSPATTS